MDNLHSKTNTFFLSLQFVGKEIKCTFAAVMSVKKLFKRYSLLVSICVGTIVYFLFANVTSLYPVGDAVTPFLIGSLPYVMAALLYVTFCKIKLKEMRPRRWHMRLQLIYIAISSVLALAAAFCTDASTKLVLEGIFICFICPTAAAAAVVADKLGGNISSLTIYTIMSNLLASLLIPLFFPMIEKGVDISFFKAFVMVLYNVTGVLVLPLLLAIVSKRVLPRFVRWIASVKDLAFYMWCYNLAIVTGLTVRNTLHSSVSGWVLALLLFSPALVAIIQFAIGKAVGRPYGENISAGQSFGQKNTVVAIWLTITFLNPLAALAPGAYVIWQNLINAWQLWYKDKFGYVKW